MSLNDEVYKQFKDALSDLTANLKPVITSLTMLADDYKNNARDVVRAVEEFLEQAPTERKLLGLYLMDSIIKNLKDTSYVKIFQENIVRIFANVFECVDEQNRKALYKLRQTWITVYSSRVLYTIDISVNNIDPAWPITAKQETNNVKPPQTVASKVVQKTATPPPPPTEDNTTSPQKVLLEVNERKKKLEEQQQIKKVPQQQLQSVVVTAKTQPQITTVRPSKPTSAAAATQMSVIIEPQQQKQQQNSKVNGTSPIKTTTIVKSSDLKPKQQQTVAKSTSSVDSRDPRLLKQASTKPPTTTQKVSPTASNIKKVSPTASTTTKSSPPSTKTTPPMMSNKKPVKRTSPVALTDQQDNNKKAKMSTAGDTPVKAVTAAVKAKVAASTPTKTTKLISPPLPPKVVSKKPLEAKKLQPAAADVLGDIFGSGDIDYRAEAEAAAAAAASTVSAKPVVEQTPVIELPDEKMDTTSSSSNLTAATLPVEEMSKNVGIISELEKLLLTTAIPKTTANASTASVTSTGIVDVIKNLLLATSTAATVVKSSSQDMTMMSTTSIAPTASTEATTSTFRPVPLMSTQPAPPPNLMFLDLSPSASSNSVNMSGYATYIPPIRPRDKHEQEDSLLVIDGRSYRIQPDQRRVIKIYYHDHELYCDTRTKDVYIDSKRVYRMGDTTKEVMLNGRRVRLMYMGKRIELWINGVSFHFRADSPPKQISITSPLTGFTKRYYVTIDGRTMDMLFNHYKVCNLNAGLRNRELVQTVKLTADDFETHEIAYMCPSKRIMIDDQPRIMRYDLPIPCVEIDGLFYVIRFSGTPRSIMIDDMKFEVPWEGVKRIRLNNRAHELAWGGPGFEVIIDGRPYELQFGQAQPREVYIGARQHYIRVLGDPPDVKICGRLPDDILQQYQDELRAEESDDLQRQGQAGASGGLNLNVNELLDKLMEHKLIPKAADSAAAAAGISSGDFTTSGSIVPQMPEEPVPDLTSLDVDILKKKYNQAIQNLYGGVQCATCGMRFVNTNSKRFSNHYDWHFRQNKREKEEINIAHSRNWYYDVPEWIEYEELSEEDQAQHLQQQIDGDSRALSTQQSENISYNSSNQQMHNANNNNSDANTDLNSTNVQLNTTLSNKTSICPATDDVDDNCFICKDPFDIFWDEDKEEWFFKDAVRVGNKVYHPVCYDDVTEDNNSVPSTPSVSNTHSITSLFTNTTDPTTTNSHVNNNNNSTVLNDTIETTDNNNQEEEADQSSSSNLKGEPLTP